MKPDDDHLALERRVLRLLADPAHQGHPLADTLRDVWHQLEMHISRLERITLLSDSFQAMARDRERGLSDRFERQLRRINRIVRISDHYQKMLHELNTHLEEASFRDILTGIDNRRALMQRLQQETLQANEQGGQLILAMVDVDRFKHINDAFGHEAGDRALIEIAQLLNQDLRPTDACGRWGGEEFLLILPNTSMHEAYAILERKLQAVRELSQNTSFTQQGHPFTISAGLAKYLPDEPLSSTLSRADAALYVAKHRGRDRIAPSPEEAAELESHGMSHPKRRASS